MRVLVLNAGSSSLKYQVIHLEDGAEQVEVKGSVERIGSPGGAADHRIAVREALARAGAVDAVGHRVVHGGEKYREAVRIDAEVERVIEECCALAPLHNPPNLACYRAARDLLGGVPHVAVFDTAFFHSLEPHVFLYGLPLEYYERDHIRRYGFHGTSHRYVSARAAELLGKSPGDCRLITCHLGNGCSICAVRGGRAVDVSLGFTPIEGLVMGTRCGDIDPGVVFHLMRAKGMTLDEVEDLFIRRGGLLGLSGRSNDMRDLVEAAAQGHARARLAIDVFCYRAKKYIGAYWAVLGGADAVVFTGGIGENRAEIRNQILEGLGHLGRFEVLVIPTHEELLIARETARVVSGTGTT
ncbi:MAG: acetate kinase [Bryobacteraceae bacterium]|nr:MAG: acetate kinase [Bryobacteraceae bacterium]